MNDISISRLTEQHAAEMSQLLLSASKDYSRYFIPFEFDEDSIRDCLGRAMQDRYWGIFCGSTLAGLFMLRGFDEGYVRPAFGVYIGERFANKGLSKLAMQCALSWCRLNRISALMLKVHPDNRYALRTYERSGFQFIETCPKTGHHIMEKRFK